MKVHCGYCNELVETPCLSITKGNCPNYKSNTKIMKSLLVLVLTALFFTACVKETPPTPCIECKDVKCNAFNTITQKILSRSVYDTQGTSTCKQEDRWKLDLMQDSIYATNIECTCKESYIK